MGLSSSCVALFGCGTKDLSDRSGADWNALLTEPWQDPQALRSLVLAQQTRPGATVLHHAAKAGNLAFFEALASCKQWSAPSIHGHGPRSTKGMSLERCLNKKDEDGCTALAVAAASQHGSICALLLSLGADPWAADFGGGRTALHYACMRGCPGTISAIMGNLSPSCDRRKFVNMATRAGMTPLHLAVASGDSEAVRVLLSYGPEKTAHLAAGLCVSPLDMATSCGNSSVVLKLMNHYMTPKAGDDVSQQAPDRAVSVVPTLAKLAGKVQKAALQQQLAAVLADGFAAPGDVPLSTDQVEHCTGYGDGCLSHDTLQPALCSGLTHGSGPDAATGSHDSEEGTFPLSSTGSLSGMPTCQGAGGLPAQLLHSCPICLDAEAQVRLGPCSHRMCSNCTVQMVTWQVVSRPVTCPLCQQPVASISK